MLVRAYMSNKIGAEGMGLYQLIFSIYVLAVCFVTAGTSTAVIRFITMAIAKNESNGKIRKIMVKSVLIAFLLSIIGVIIFYILAEPISIYLLKDERCILSIKILVLALPFVSISACIKGFFIAYRNVKINSISQLLEQFARIVCLFTFLELKSTSKIEVICMYVILSDIISEASALIYLYFKYRKEMKGVSSKKYLGFRLKDFLKISIPVTMDSYLTSTLRTIENVLIPSKLTQYTLSREVSLSQFGYLKGMALPLAFFPASFLTALSTLLVPETSEAATLNDNSKIKKMVSNTFKFTFICSMLISIIFFIYAKEIGLLFYKNEEVEFYIKYLAPLIPFMYMESAIDGIMTGLNQQSKSLKYNVIDSVIRITSICIFLPISGIKGFLIIMYISNITTSCLNAYRVLKVSKVKFSILDWVIKPLISSISAYIAFTIIFQNIIIANSFIDMAFKALTISFFYILMLFLFGIVDRPFLKNFKRRNV